MHATSLTQWWEPPRRDFLDLDPEHIVRAVLATHSRRWTPAMDMMVSLDPRLRVFARAFQVVSLALSGHAMRWTEVEPFESYNRRLRQADRGQLIDMYHRTVGAIHRRSEHLWLTPEPATTLERNLWHAQDWFPEELADMGSLHIRSFLRSCAHDLEHEPEIHAIVLYVNEEQRPALLKRFGEESEIAAMNGKNGTGAEPPEETVPAPPPSLAVKTRTPKTRLEEKAMKHPGPPMVVVNRPELKRTDAYAPQRKRSNSI